ncbi:VapC toxin family PIN domain ribonuclease [Bordetella genomosp. 1]|uniref:Ribonuclease VapC n=1 Tax=Bordetella genomosp. 1 TaxID=1395607 RepID=A0A261RXL8_9BORD|nr:tRNA(fMet)-specific endonuclease VapC [Bordetella genomosp. 1]OZI29003.1 VapC toxin family PIN domain ribonuclease [Bordetella genomosp. 1]OZI68103.1 VapC toxin family PIN domain ribonuclease [Bordetella genomosp. 1]
MLDTNICIHAINRTREGVRRAYERHSSVLCVSTVTFMELAYGVQKSNAPLRSRLAMEGFLARVDILDYDQPAAVRTGQLRGHLARAGTPIGFYDAMIAGHALACGLILVTNNTREFARVPELRLEDWTRGTG